MLSQAEIDDLLSMLKRIKGKGTITFPASGTRETIDLVSAKGREKFIVDINRKGRISITKCTFQQRYKKDIILLRLDLDGAPHTNPDGEVLPTPHLHISKEGYDDRWAYRVDQAIFGNTTDLMQTLIDFLNYCKVADIGAHPIQGGYM